MNQIIIKMILITWKKNQFSLKNQTKMKQEKKFNFINYLKIYIYIYSDKKKRINYENKTNWKTSLKF
jgi:hypothetical protein